MKKFALAIPFLFTLASLLQLYYISAIVVSPNQIVRPLLVLWLLLFFLLGQSIIFYVIGIGRRYY